MRVLLACLIGLAHASVLKAEDPNRSVTSLNWQAPFSPIESDTASSLSVLMVITNDEPFGSASPDEQREAGQPTLWCVSQIESGFNSLLRDRPDLSDRFVLQGFAAGMPQVLTGGEPSQLASRVLIALSDADYRLLGLHIGVPDKDDLIAFVEDAEEVSRFREIRSRQDRREPVNRLTFHRSEDRLERMWQGVVRELLPEPDFGERDTTQAADESGKPIDRLRLLTIIETLDAAYLRDVRRRFGLQGPDDQTRLALLEQHVQTREPWCDALLPLIEGQDFSILWRDLLELTWYHPPVFDWEVDQDLLDWIDHQLESSAVVLRLEPPMRTVRPASLPGNASLSKHIERWQTVNQLAWEYPFRTVTVQQLAMVRRHRQLNPIDIQQPSLARYIFLEPGRPRPLVVGANDSPARFANRLKRARNGLSPRTHAESE